MIDIINVDNHDFLIRHITIFENTNEQMDVMVGSTALQYYLSHKSNETNENDKYTAIDETICYYVQPMELIKMSDEQLREIVEKSY